MTKDETYNGWTNYESWLVALWIDNDQGAHEEAREIAQAAASDMAAGEAIKDWLGDWHDNPTTRLFTDNPTTGLFTDLINAALSRVDWREVGSHFRA